jgi:hypothetical protein
MSPFSRLVKSVLYVILEGWGTLGTPAFEATLKTTKVVTKHILVIAERRPSCYLDHHFHEWHRLSALACTQENMRAVYLCM